jgi:Arc/MetJ-type ribon-helix-helix transcriptional regulator
MAELASQRLIIPTDNGDELLDEKISIPLSKGLLKRIQDYRFAHRYSSQSDAVRFLIEQGLKTVPWRGKSLS